MLEGIVIGALAVTMLIGFVFERRDHRHFCEDILPAKLMAVQASLDEDGISADLRSERQIWLFELQQAQHKCEE